MISQLLPWLIVFALYIECGRRTFQVLVLDDLGDKAFLQSLVDGSTPRWFILVYYLMWGPIQLTSWTIAQVFKIARVPRTYP